MAFVIKNNLGLILCFTMLLACSSTKKIKYNSPDIQGVYSQDSLKQKNLWFRDNKFTYYETSRSGLAIYTCCDTITKGTYEIDKVNNLVYLSTSDYLNDFVLDSKIEEKGNLKDDSLYFNLINPVESSLAGYPKKLYNRLFYRVIVEGSDYLFLSQISSHIYDTSLIKIYVPSNIQITSFHLEIYPNYNALKLRNYSVKFLRTNSYSVNKRESRVFNVNIPDLTYSYLSYVRLNRDIIRIVDTNKLEWDGHYFIK